MDRFHVIAPARADLAGGTLDIWPLYCFTGGGRTINVALDLQAKATFEISPSVVFKAEIIAPSGEVAVLDEVMEPDMIRQLPGPLQFPVWVVNQYLRQNPSAPEKQVRIRLESAIPLRSGLGGSSALCVVLARGLARFFGDYYGQGWQWNLLSWVRDVEAGFLRTSTGTQDYLAALFGGLQCYTSGIGQMSQTAYSDAAFDGLSERLLVVFSGEMHHSGLSNWEVFKGAMEKDRDIVRGLEGIRDVAEQLDAELTSGNLNWKYIGQYFNEEWKVRKTLFKVQTARLEEIIQFLTKKGVLGIKVCGAAQGGSLVALIEPARRAELVKACAAQGIQALDTRPCKQGVSVEVP